MIENSKTCNKRRRKRRNKKRKVEEKVNPTIMEKCKLLNIPTQDITQDVYNKFQKEAYGLDKSIWYDLRKNDMPYEVRHVFSQYVTSKALELNHVIKRDWDDEVYIAYWRKTINLQYIVDLVLSQINKVPGTVHKTWSDFCLDILDYNIAVLDETGYKYAFNILQQSNRLPDWVVEKIEHQKKYLNLYMPSADKNYNFRPTLSELVTTKPEELIEFQDTSIFEEEVEMLENILEKDYSEKETCTINSDVPDVIMTRPDLIAAHDEWLETGESLVYQSNKSWLDETYLDDTHIEVTAEQIAESEQIDKMLAEKAIEQAKIDNKYDKDWKSILSENACKTWYTDETKTRSTGHKVRADIDDARSSYTYMGKILSLEKDGRLLWGGLECEEVPAELYEHHESRLGQHGHFVKAEDPLLVNDMPVFWHDDTPENEMKTTSSCLSATTICRPTQWGEELGLLPEIDGTKDSFGKSITFKVMETPIEEPINPTTVQEALEEMEAFNEPLESDELTTTAEFDMYTKMKAAAEIAEFIKQKGYTFVKGITIQGDSFRTDINIEELD